MHQQMDDHYYQDRGTIQYVSYLYQVWGISMDSIYIFDQINVSQSQEREVCVGVPEQSVTECETGRDRDR